MGLVSFGAGVALGYVLGHRNSAADVERARQVAAQAWQDPKVQETVQRVESTANAVANEFAQKSQEVLASAAEAVKQVLAESSAATRQEPDPSSEDIVSDPALSTEDAGSDWSDEGGSSRSASS